MACTAMRYCATTCARARESFLIFLLITGARVTAHSDPVSRIVIDEQGGDLVDLLLAGRVEELAAGLKGDRFDTQSADLPQTLPRLIAQGFEVDRTASLPPHHRRGALEQLFQKAGVDDHVRIPLEWIARQLPRYA